MSSNSTEIPSIESELNRKAFEELENLVNRREGGKVTNAEYMASINTLFAVCSGIVDRGFFELITEAAKEGEVDHSFSRKRLFRKGNKITILSQAASKDAGFPLIAISATVFDEKSIVGDGEEILAKIAKLVTKLESAGFVEIY